MNDATILQRVSALVDKEHALRSQRAPDASGSEGAALEELRQVEVELDQCWDLLRQRRARREFGEDPETAASRPASVVENYWQ
jgi:hypothetical protein